MSEEKKAVVVKSTDTKKVEPKKIEPKKVEPKKTELKKAVKTSTTTKKATAKKTTTKKTAAKKAIVKTAKTAEINQNVYVQFPGREVLAKDVVARIKGVWTDEMNKKISEIKTLNVYLNTTEYKAYYVINEEVTGSMDI